MAFGSLVPGMMQAPQMQAPPSIGEMGMSILQQALRNKQMNPGSSGGGPAIPMMGGAASLPQSGLLQMLLGGMGGPKMGPQQPLSLDPNSVPQLPVADANAPGPNALTGMW